MAQYMTAEEFIAARMKLNMSQEEIGEELDRKIYAIRRWERGVTPVPSMAAFCVKAMLAGYRPDKKK